MHAYHPLLNLIWFPFAWMYLAGYTGNHRLQEPIILGVFWVVVCMLIDLVGWVLIPHPWAMTFREFYVGYQPWITLIYLVIFISPIAAYYVQEAYFHRHPQVGSAHVKASVTGENQ